MKILLNGKKLEMISANYFAISEENTENSSLGKTKYNQNHNTNPLQFRKGNVRTLPYAVLAFAFLLEYVD
tara:strand:+ start:525 stop:734 length:210 start_codon:yes stop_codon:yes gene_type:complete